MKEPFRRKVKKPQRGPGWSLRNFNPTLYHVHICPVAIFATIGLSIIYSFKGPIITIATEIRKIRSSEKIWAEFIAEALVSVFVLWLLLTLAVWLGNAITNCRRPRRNKTKRR